MAGRWFRLDADWDSSEWVYGLSPLAQLAWVKLLCHCKRSGQGCRVRAESPVVFAGKNQLSVEAVEEMLTAAQAGDEPAVRTEGKEWVLTAWDVYNPPDTTAAHRMRKLRAKQAGSDGSSGALRRNNRNEHRNLSMSMSVDVPEKDAPSEEEILFELAWKAYPKRPNNPKAKARRAFMARVSEGVEPRTLMEAVDRYAAYCKRNRVEPRFTKLAATFFGPDEHWKEEFEDGDTNHDIPVADILEVMGGEYSAWLGSADVRPHAFAGLAKDYPELWARAGPALQKLKFMPLFEKKSRGDTRGLTEEIERQLSNGRS